MRMGNKRMAIATPKPIFDTLAEINEVLPSLKGLAGFAKKDFHAAWGFLKQYDGNNATFASYRREVERLFQWALYVT